MGFFKDCGCGCNGARQQKKFMISVMSALVFFLISSPELYKLTTSTLGKWVAVNGCPTTLGLVLHSIVFLLVTWGLMNINESA